MLVLARCHPHLVSFRHSLHLPASSACPLLQVSLLLPNNTWSGLEVALQPLSYSSTPKGIYAPAKTIPRVFLPSMKFRGLRRKPAEEGNSSRTSGAGVRKGGRRKMMRLQKKRQKKRRTRRKGTTRRSRK